jgi:high-affinity nickel permease
LRHGFDYDHIAAIADISSIQRNTRDAMRFGFLYILGHATTVAGLGAAAILFRLSLPVSVDPWAERLVGFTLVVLGLYVLGDLLFSSGHLSSDDRHQRPKTKLTILVNGFLWLYWRLRRLLGKRDEVCPQLFREGYGSASSLAVGMIHGIGAETPTQLLLFLMAANLGGATKGFLGLLMFIAGMVAMNTIMCASAAGVFRAGVQRPRLYRGVIFATALYSLIAGMIFISGWAWRLPSLAG